MGILDNVKGLLGGSGKETVPITLEDGETEIARALGCTVKGEGHPWVGGELVQTNRRLLFTPWNTKDAAALLSYGLKRAGASGGPAVVGWLQGQIQSAATDVSGLVSAEASRSATVTHPPTIVVRLQDGRSLEFGVLAERLSPNFSKENERARDEFLAVVQANLP